MNYRGFACVGLHLPKTPVNIASALRACGCYRASMMAISGMRYKKHCADTMARYRHMPLLQVDDMSTVVPYDCVPVAVDLVEGAVPLQNYEHPRSAFYVFGPEDGTLGASVLEWCRDVVMVPTSRCMNLAATVNVVLYDRLAKQLRKQENG